MAHRFGVSPPSLNLGIYNSDLTFPLVIQAILEPCPWSCYFQHHLGVAGVCSLASNPVYRACLSCLRACLSYSTSRSGFLNDSRCPCHITPLPASVWRDTHALPSAPHARLMAASSEHSVSLSLHTLYHTYIHISCIPLHGNWTRLLPRVGAIQCLFPRVASYPPSVSFHDSHHDNVPVY